MIQNLIVLPEFNQIRNLRFVFVLFVAKPISNINAFVNKVISCKADFVQCGKWDCCAIQEKKKSPFANSVKNHYIKI